MNTSSLQHKTIRPGSLAGYSYYYSGNRRTVTPVVVRKPRFNGLSLKLMATVLAIVAIIGLPLLRGDSDQLKQAATNQATINTAQPQGSQAADSNAALAPAATQPAETTECTGNTEPKLVVVSVGKRHMWACEGEKVAHHSHVITGLETLEENKTPRGSYKISGKQADTRLTGSDSRGSWDRPVHYWMPFLENQYGIYGFHDATWKADTDFGNVDPNTSDETSRGCVELPLATAKWLYEWAAVGTAIVIEN